MTHLFVDTKGIHRRGNYASSRSHDQIKQFSH